VGLQLVPDHVVVPARVSARAVDDVHEDPRPLDVAEERVAQPGAAARTLDQPRDVRDRRATLVVFREVHDAQVRLERRERIVGDLGTGGGERGEERRLAGVWQADEADVGDQPKLQPQPALLAGLALLGVFRRLVR
jgi:hypothetical protein